MKLSKQFKLVQWLIHWNCINLFFFLAELHSKCSYSDRHLLGTVTTQWLHSDYTVTDYTVTDWRCSHCWQLPAAWWLHSSDGIGVLLCRFFFSLYYPRSQISQNYKTISYYIATFPSLYQHFLGIGFKNSPLFLTIPFGTFLYLFSYLRIWLYTIKLAMKLLKTFHFKYHIKKKGS